MGAKKLSCERIAGVHWITLPKKVDPETALEIESRSAEWLESDATLHVLNFKDVEYVHPHVYRSVVSLQKSLKHKNVPLVSMNMDRLVMNAIATDGLASVFSPVSSLNELKVSASATTPIKFEVNFLNTFIKATEETFDTQVSLKVHPEKPALKATQETSKFDIAGVITVNCDEFNGSIALLFSAPTFLSVYERMLGEKHEQITDEVKDAAAELLNIIYGQAKTLLKSRGHTLLPTIPAVFVGENIKLNYHSRNPTLVIPFQSDVGVLRLEIVIQQTKEKSHV